MSSTQQILISSAYRNRLLYPNPADFIVQFGVINNANRSVFDVFTTTNPVSIGFPDYNFCWTNFNSCLFDEGESTFSTSIIGGNAINPVLYMNVNRQLLKIIGSNPEGIECNIPLEQRLINCFDILAGLILKIYPSSLDDTFYIRRIIAYNPITSTVTLNNPFPNFSLEDGPIRAEILNISVNASEGAYISINGPFPSKASVLYLNYDLFLYDLTINEIRKVIEYDQIGNIFQLETPFSIDKWNITDQYWIISRQSPYGIGTIHKFDNGKYYQYLPTPSDFIFVSTGTFLYKQNQKVMLVADDSSMTEIHIIYRIRQISSNNILLELDTLNDSFHYSYSTQQFRLVPVEISSYQQDWARFAIVRISSLSVAFYCEFKTNLASVDNYFGQYFCPVLLTEQYSVYNNKVILTPNLTIPPISNNNEPIDLLTSQNRMGCFGIRSALKLSNGRYIVLVQSIKTELLFRLDYLSGIPDNEQPPGISNFLIIPYSYEGVVPLNFTGTSITQSQMSCYEMTILCLILPNRVINSPEGLLTSAYPYVFLEITNETLPSGHNRSIIYSNNPYSVKATFICSISDVNNPEKTRFIKISSDGAKQILKFSPLDNLRIRIFLPNGQTFETEETDYLVPNEPNPRLQIDILAEMKRID